MDDTRLDRDTAVMVGAAIQDRVARKFPTFHLSSEMATEIASAAATVFAGGLRAKERDNVVLTDRYRDAVSMLAEAQERMEAAEEEVEVLSTHLKDARAERKLIAGAVQLLINFRA